MQYGHASLIPILVFGGMFLVRYLTSQRRRGGPPAGPGPHSPFTGAGPPGPGGHPSPTPPTIAGDPSHGMPAGWFRDPFVRHEQRFWSGSEWTDHVMDDGVPGIDAAPKPPGPADAD